MRTTQDPKTHMVRVRLNEEMHEYISVICRREGNTVSGYIRKLINADMGVVSKNPEKIKGGR